MGINRASGSKYIGMLTGANRLHIAATLLASLALFPVAPAFAIDGEILITHAKALAGNVTPGDPAGYPVTISIPGSFKLASNLFVAANKIGIQVTSNEVTLDLNGFKLEGSDVGWYGVTGGTNAVTIENGTIARFKFNGINGGSGKYWIVENVRSIENGRNGMALGQFALIKSSVAVENTARGIYASDSSLIQGNTVSYNGTFGVEAYRSTVIENVIIQNGSYGVQANGATGYSGNTLVANNSGGDQAFDVLPQHPNACFGACP